MVRSFGLNLFSNPLENYDVKHYHKLKITVDKNVVIDQNLLRKRL